MERVASAMAKTKRATGETDRSLKAMGSAFDGTRLEGTALRMAEGVRRVGGAAKLTGDEFRRVERSVDAALEAIRIKGGQANSTLLAMKRELDGVKHAADGAGSKISAGLGALASGFGVGLGAGAGLGALTALGGALKDLVADAGRLTPLQQSFERMQGGAANAERSLATLRTATRGLVSDADLLQAANKGSLLGLQDMGIKFDEVARVATTLGRAMGQDAAKSVDDLTTALSRMSPQILDNLGIKVDLTAATAAYAQAIGKSVEALTEEERKRAFATAAMEAARAKAAQLGDVQLTVLEQTSRITTALGDMAAQAVSTGNQSVTLAGQLGQVADALLRIRNAKPGESGDIIAGYLNRTGQAAWATAQQQYNAAPWYMKPLAAGSFGPMQLGGRLAQYAAPLFGNPNYLPLPVNPLDPTIPAMSAGGSRLGGATTPTRTAGGGSSAAVESAQRGLANVLLETGRQYLSAAKTNYDAARGFLTAARVQIQASSDSGLRGRDLTQALYGSLSLYSPGQGVGVPANASRFSNSIASVAVDFQKGLPAVRSWNVEMRGIAQAFAQVAQIAGPSLDGVTRGLGTVVASADAANQLTLALSNTFKGLGDGNGNLSTAGKAVAGGIAGLTTGLQLGGLTSNRAVGVLGGAGGGAVAGFMAGGPYGAIAGGVIGGLSGLFAANQNRKAQRQQMEAMRQQIIASYGTLDDFKRAVVSTGYSWDYFLGQFNSSNPETFQRAVTSLNTALAEQKSRADKLVTSLEKLAQRQGVLSRQQLAQVRNLKPGDPGYDEVNAFLQGQTAQAEAGIVAAVDALGRYTGNVLADFGGSVNAAAAGLVALFGEAIARGESAVQIIGRLGGAFTTLQGLYEKNGGTMPAGLSGITDLAGIINGPNTGIAVQTAGGLGSALAGLSNTGVFAAMPELFGQIANGIGSAWKALENFGAGGQKGLAIFQPYLQTLWEIIDANPELRDQLDEQTRAALEFAEANGVIGDKFRDSSEKMLTALDRLIEKLDTFITRLGQVPGLPTGPATGPAPGTGTPGGGNGGSGGDYDGFAIGSGGVRDFGRETMVRLHGREAVLTEAQYETLQAQARMGVRGSAPAWGGVVRVEAPLYMNNRRVGLGVAEVTPGLLQTYGAR